MWLSLQILEHTLVVTFQVMLWTGNRSVLHRKETCSTLEQEDHSRSWKQRPYHPREKFHPDPQSLFVNTMWAGCQNTWLSAINDLSWLFLKFRALVHDLSWKPTINIIVADELDGLWSCFDSKNGNTPYVQYFISQNEDSRTLTAQKKIMYNPFSSSTWDSLLKYCRRLHSDSTSYSGMVLHREFHSERQTRSRAWFCLIKSHNLHS